MSDKKRTPREPVQEERRALEKKPSVWYRMYYYMGTHRPPLWLYCLPIALSVLSIVIVIISQILR